MPDSHMLFIGQMAKLRRPIPPLLHQTQRSVSRIRARLEEGFASCPHDKADDFTHCLAVAGK